MIRYDARMIAPKLKQLKHEKGLSESELARRAGVSPPTITKILGGTNINPTIGTMIAIAKVFGVCPAWFIEC